jgi:trimeric autotransporter adhesin
VTSQVAWSSAAPTVASISATGLASALNTGSSTITSGLDNVTASTVLIVTPAALVSISITPANGSLPQGATRQYTATGMFSDQTTEDFTNQAAWSSTATDVATVSTTGFVTAVTLGSSTIGASFGGLDATTTVTVAAPALASISVSPTTAAVPRGETQQFSATGVLTNGSTEDLTNQVTWSSSALNVATITTMGLAQTLQSGTTTISATLGDIHGSTILTAGPTALISISVSPASASIVKGSHTKLEATGVFSDQTTQDLSKVVVWASNARGVATINSTGQVSGVTPGTATITASIAGVTGSATLAVKDLSQLMMIMISPDGSTLLKGQTQQFSAVGMFDDNSTEDLDGQVVWSSGAASVASVSQSGKATGVSPGAATIIANFGGVTGSTVLTVQPAVLQAIVVVPGGASIPKGETQQLTAIGVFSDQSTQTLTNQVTWISSNLSVASVSPTGLATGLNTGSSALSARLGAVSGTTVLSVAPAALLAISVTSDALSVPSGGRVQFKASGVFSDQSTADLTPFVSWSSANPGVVAVSATGLATGLNTGSAAVVASLNGVSGSAGLTVTVPPDPHFTATGLTLKASSRTKFNGAVANFKDPNTKAANFLATIDWGDQTGPVSGKIRQTAKGRYSVSGAHHYVARGTFHVTVTIRDSAGRVVSTSSSARVAK